MLEGKNLDEQEKMYAFLDGRMAYDLDNTTPKDIHLLMLKITNPDYHKKTLKIFLSKEMHEIALDGYIDEYRRQHAVR